MTAPPSLHAVSLFSNCGAGDVGYARAGFRFSVLAELLADRIAVAELNHPGADGVQGDLRETLPLVIDAWRDAHGDLPPDLLAACPPCQGMSTARGHRGSDADVEAGARDPRNLLVQVIAGAVEELRPRVVVVENVPAFLTRKVRHPESGHPVSAAAYLIGRLASHYALAAMVSDLADYGVPQHRRRSFLTFVRHDEPGLGGLRRRGVIPFPAPTHDGAHRTVRQALQAADLPTLDASRSDLARSNDPLHAVPVWTADRYRMVSAIPVDIGASAWHNDTCPTCGTSGIKRQLARCPGCDDLLLRPVIEDDEGFRLIAGFPTSYARMPSDRPAATITTASGRVGSDYAIHPWENRVLSVRECQLLQTIPADFAWGDTLTTYGHTRVRAMIGEAVPPAFTRQHGRVLAALLSGRRPQSCMSATDQRMVRAERSLRSTGTSAGPMPTWRRGASGEEGDLVEAVD